MAKLNEITFDVREALKAYTDDSEIDDRYILYLYNIKRAKYLRQDLNNFQKTTDLSIQQNLCMGLEEVSANECGLEVFCEKVVRTKKPIPKAIELHTKPAITKVKPTSRLAVPFNFITKDKAPFLSYSPYSKSIYAFLDTDNHIYLLSESDTYNLMECISVTGIFENPLDLSNFKDCCGCTEPQDCFDEETSEYPLQPHYIDLIRAEIVQDLLRTKQINEDKDNDSNDPTYSRK